ncbi:MAG: tetratricopeptide repeat-containing sensor histidine kinase [Bacteroidota bacterium]
MPEQSSTIASATVADMADVRVRVDQLNAEAESISRSDPAQMLRLAQDAKTLAEEYQYEPGLAYALYYAGSALWRMSHFSEALEFLKDSLALFEKLDDNHGRLRVLLNTGLVHQSQGKFDVALSHLFDALEIANLTGDTALKATILGNLGSIYNSLGRYDKAMAYYFEVLPMVEDAGDMKKSAGLLANIANTYINLGQFETALTYQNKAAAVFKNLSDKVGLSRILLNIGYNYESREELTTALEYYTDALKIFEEISDASNEAVTLLNISVVYRKQGNFDSALEFLHQSLALAEKIGDARLETLVLANIGEVFKEQGDDENALSHLEIALQGTQELALKQREYEIHAQLSGLFEKSGDTAKAFEHFKKYTELREETLNQKIQENVAGMQLRFNVEKSEKEKEIFRLRNVELSSALAQVEALNKHLVELNNEKNEFLGIAAHDLKNPLAGIMLSASLLQHRFDRMTPEQRSRYLGQIEVTAKRMSDIITNLLDINTIESGSMNIAIEKVNLDEAIQQVLKDYQERCKAKDISVTYFAKCASPLVLADKNALTAVLENIFSNALKYSPLATSIAVELNDSNGSLECSIRDSGPGISTGDQQNLFKKFARLSAKPTAGEHSTGLGLWIVKKLTDLMNGNIRCESELGQGTTFFLKLPKNSF